MKHTQLQVYNKAFMAYRHALIILNLQNFRDPLLADFVDIKWNIFVISQRTFCKKSNLPNGNITLVSSRERHDVSIYPTKRLFSSIASSGEQQQQQQQQQPQHHQQQNFHTTYHLSGKSTGNQ